MAKLSLTELKSVVASYVDANKVSVDTYTITRDNIVGLVDKIAKIFTLDTSYADKLAIFDGEQFSMAKDIEEWQQDLIMVSDYSASGDDALSPSYPTYRPPFYSKSLGKKVFKTTIPNNNVERAVHFVEQFESIVAMQSKRLFDSEAIWRYEQKREILAKMIAEIDLVYATTKTFTANTKYDVGEYLRSASSGLTIQYGVVVKPIAVATALSSWANAVAGGYVIVADLKSELAVPTDSTSGEAFIEQLKKDIEVASDVSEGHSLSGSTLGATGSLVLLVKQGIVPSLDVNTLAGAFHLDKLSMPEAPMIVIKDFGSDNTGVYAMLIDSRSVRLHNSYRAVRENMNGSGDFLNLFLHTENTAHYSRNTFVKIYRPASV